MDSSSGTGLLTLQITKLTSITNNNRIHPIISGRLRSTVFMDLPSAVDYPDYYQFIKRPIALNQIRAKLESTDQPYTTFEKFLADLRLVFKNAKRYNLEQSTIYEDARELLRLIKLDSSQPGEIPQPIQTTPFEPLERVEQPKHKKLKLKFRASVSNQELLPVPNSLPATSVPEPSLTPELLSNSEPTAAVEPSTSPKPPLIASEPANEPPPSPVLSPKRVTPPSEAPPDNQIPAPEVPSRPSTPPSLPPPPQASLSNSPQPIPSAPAPAPQSELLIPRTSPSVFLSPDRSPQIPTDVACAVPETPKSPGKELSKKDALVSLKAWIKSTIKSLDNVTDRTGRKLIEEFQTLPDKTRWKTYYQVIPDPLAFDDIRARNERNGYKHIESFEEDVITIFKNAQHFNEDGSIVWKDSKTLEARFLEAVKNAPPELAHLGPRSPQSKRRASPRGRKEHLPAVIALVQPHIPQRAATPPNIPAAITAFGLRRSPRSPSRPPSAGGSPNGRLTRQVSPLPKSRASSPLGNSINPNLITNGLLNTRPTSRLANEISPALISQLEDHSATSHEHVSRLKDRVGGAMIKKFKICTIEPKTIESFKIKNSKVSQHAFKLPADTTRLTIVVYLNRSWPSERRQLRSSSLSRCLVEIEKVRVRGPGCLIEKKTVNENGSNGGAGAKGWSKGNLKCNGDFNGGFGTIKVEVDLGSEGMNVVEIYGSGKKEGSSVISNGGAENGNLVREIYRLFIYR
ncbi:expressed protein [Phakopsora pachyrhizi]|uniref:Expressed protein n=1 Tax=Phakopsora pachyrhizi TaxID=170000 RepID=A0AAV0BBC6_PHAPC|nr:expressed protein [Phakopsora pachyrhizi]